MHSLGINLRQIDAALRNFGTNTAGGFVEHNARELITRNVGLSISLGKLRHVVIDMRGSQLVHLGQVASVDFAARPKRGDVSYN